MTKIAIIGAGMAAVSALHVLAAEHEVTVFDKSRGSGGRMASKQLDGYSWDMGAQFMLAHSQEFASILDVWLQHGWIAPWEVTPYVLKNQQLYRSQDNKMRYVGVNRMSALTRQLLAPATEFIPNTQIVKLQHDLSGWQLFDAQQKTYSGFEALLITCPPAQTSALLPAYSELAETINQVKMLPCWSLLLAFEKRLDVAIDLAFVYDEPLHLLVRNSSKPTRSSEETWVVHASAAYSLQHQDSCQEQVAKTLKTAFLEQLQITDAKIQKQWIQRWLYANCEHRLNMDYLLDNKQKLAVAGDWCLAGTLESAWLSGQQAAGALLEVLH